MKKIKLTTEEFIERAKQIHGEKYDYSLVEYNGYKEKVKIICPIHGVFEQISKDHLRGCGCSKCKKVKKLTTEEFIKRAKEIHGEKYDYSLVEYKNIDTKIKIICPIHGVFEQTPYNHLHYECKKCSKEKQQAFNKRELYEAKVNFIERAKQIHGEKYDYSLVEYKNTSTKVKIKCIKHNIIFEQTPSMHISSKQGCPICKESKGEKQIYLWLNKKNITFEYQKRFSDLKDKDLLSYDFYIPSKKVLIEYNGIQHYKIINFFSNRNKFLLQKHHDWLKRKYAKDNNINLLIIPYWDFDNINKILEEKIF